MNKKDMFTMDYFNLTDEIKCQGNPKLLSEKEYLLIQKK